MIRLIKRYGGGSRKLYDTEESRYVSLDQIARWIRGGQELQVVDSATGDDVTAQTLAQVIYEDHKRGFSLLPSDMLHDMIRRGGHAISSGVGQLQTGVDRLVRASVDRLAPKGETQQELQRLHGRLTDLERSLASLEELSVETPASPRGKRPPARKRTASRRRS